MGAHEQIEELRRRMATSIIGQETVIERLVIGLLAAVANSAVDARSLSPGMDQFVSLSRQILALTTLLVATMGWQWMNAGSWRNLWLTADQQGYRAFNNRDFQQAADLFRDADWAGIASYESGHYEEAAGLFSRSVEAAAAYNRGNALMKARKYQQAIGAYEIAVDSEPDWVEARENLELAIYVSDYIERVREEGDTGDESELSADGYVFDNRRNIR